MSLPWPTHTTQEWQALLNLTPAEIARLHALGGPGSGNFGHAGRPGEQGGSAATSSDPSGISVVGSQSDREKIHAALAMLPKGLAKESKVNTIYAMASQGEAKQKIDEYLLKHYGFTASESATGLVDRERGVMYTLTDPKNTFTQFSHTLVDRIQSPEWQQVVSDHKISPEYKEDAFAKAFAALAQAEPMTLALEGAAHLFKKWGWL